MAKQIKLPIDISDLVIPPLELKFIGIYCTHSFDEVTAYRKAFPNRIKGLSEPEVRLEALNLLNKREIKLAVERFVDSVLSPYQEKLDYQLLSVLRTRAFYDVAWYFHEDGTAKKLSEIAPEHRVVIDSVITDMKGKNADVMVTTIKLGDRTQAIKMMQELLRKKDSIEEEAADVSSDSRVRLQDIFRSVEKGIEIANKSNKPKEPIPAEVIPAQVEYSSGLEISPIVKKAKELAAKETGGIGIQDHPLVKQAKELAGRKK
jgi:hypothetical protein